MNDPSLPDKVVALHRALDAAAVSHAFGGAMSLAYYAEPRATVDVDINVFVPPTEYVRVLDALVPLGVEPGPEPGIVERDGQCRLWWGRNAVDLFFSYDAVHDAMRDWAREVPFGDETIPILAPEHLVVAKVVFNRAKDWIDLEQMLIAVPVLDFAEIERWLDHIVGRNDDRFTHFEELRQRLT